MDRIVVLDSSDLGYEEQWQKVTNGLKFYHKKEINLLNVLGESLAQMEYSKQSFKKHYLYILENNTKTFEDYYRELQTPQQQDKDSLIVFRNQRLDYHFKMFLILTKSVLDKIVPFFNYRFLENFQSFGDSGNDILDLLERSRKYKKDRPLNIHELEDFVKYIKKQKTVWIDNLITIRDEYVHKNSLGERYVDFCCFSSSAKNVHSLKDCIAPVIILSDIKNMKAIDYIDFIFDHIINFINHFLKFCKYEIYQKPPRTSKCRCGFQFGKFDLPKDSPNRKLQIKEVFAINIDNFELKLGSLICPKCNSQYDTDLEFWGKYIKIEKPK